MARIPKIGRYDYLRDKKGGFIAKLVFTDTTSVELDETVLQRAFPSIISKVVTGQNNENMYHVIMASHMSDESAKQCEKLNAGYMDMSGNYTLHIRYL